MKNYDNKIPRAICVNSLFTAFHLNYDKGYTFSGEMHNSWELVFISDGKASIAKDNRIFNLTKGNLAFHPPMEFHRIWSDDSPFRLLVISFSAEGEVLQQLSNGIYSLDITQQDALISLVEEIYRGFNMNKIFVSAESASPLSVQQAITKLELLLLELLQSGTSEKKTDKTYSARQFSRVVEVMNQHICEDLSVDDIARLANMSTSNLKKICRKYVGMGPGKHFLRLKIMQATKMLENGHTVTEVSHHFGFSGQSYFSTAFTRETGYPPSRIKSAKNFITI